MSTLYSLFRCKQVLNDLMNKGNGGPWGSFSPDTEIHRLSYY